MLSLIPKFLLLAITHAFSNKMKKKMDASDALQGFPVLTEEYLLSLTFDIYQLKQAKSYSREHINEEGGRNIC